MSIWRTVISTRTRTYKRLPHTSTFLPTDVWHNVLIHWHIWQQIYYILINRWGLEKDIIQFSIFLSPTTAMCWNPPLILSCHHPTQIVEVNLILNINCNHLQLNQLMNEISKVLWSKSMNADSNIMYVVDWNSFKTRRIVAEDVKNSILHLILPSLIMIVLSLWCSAAWLIQK